MRSLALLLLLACGCVGTKIRPMVELEHRRSHELETRFGVNLETRRHSVDVYWAPILEITDHRADKIGGYWSAAGIRWRLK